MNHRKPPNRKLHAAVIAGTTLSIAAVALAIWLLITLLNNTTG